MPLAVKDVVNSFISKSDPFVRFTLRNPLSTALTISIIICLLLIWVFKDDNISKRRIKLAKMFVYSLMLTTAVIFLQNSHIIKQRSNRSDMVLPDGILNMSGAADINMNNPDYIKPELKINGGDDTNSESVDFMIT